MIGWLFCSFLQFVLLLHCDQADDGQLNWHGAIGGLIILQPCNFYIWFCGGFEI